MDSIDRLFRSEGQIGEDLLWYVALCGFDLGKVVETNTRERDNPKRRQLMPTSPHMS
jgi:hypothetical protein